MKRQRLKYGDRIRWGYKELFDHKKLDNSGIGYFIKKYQLKNYYGKYQTYILIGNSSKLEMGGYREELLDNIAYIKESEEKSQKQLKIAHDRGWQNIIKRLAKK